MRLLWDLYWPVLAVAVLIGGLTATLAMRRSRSAPAFLAGAAAAVLAAFLWHGPLGAADRYRGKIEGAAADTLAYYEMQQVSAALQAGPLRRQIVLSGRADDFQRSELVRIMDALPTIWGARWSDQPARGWPLPLQLEVYFASLLACGLGMLLGYLIELRRRARAEWRW
jgi:hypothetical protein